MTGRDMTLQNIVKCVSNLDGPFELMAHPGYCATEGIGGFESGPDDFSRDQSREFELEFLLNQTTIEIIIP